MSATHVKSGHTKHCAYLLDGKPCSCGWSAVERERPQAVQSVACTCPANGASSACALHGDEQHRIVRIDENPESPSVKPGGGRELTHLPRGWHFRYGQRNGELFFALHGPAGELAVFPMLVDGVRADVVRLFFKGNT